MQPSRPWTVLLEKARQDEYVLDRLCSLPDSPDEVIGFHMQQAAEKLLKAALMVTGVPYRFTHNLGELIHLLETSGHPVPESLEDLRDLTPFATEWRYDFLPAEGEAEFDRLLARGLVGRLRSWVEDLIQERTNLPGS